MNAWLSKYAELVLRHRLLATALFVVLLAAGGVGAARLIVDFNTAEFFASNDASRLVLKRLKERFGRDDVRLVVLAQSDDVTAPEVIAMIHELTEALSDIEGIKRVDSLTTVTDLGATGDDGITIEPIFGVLPENAEQASAQRARALASPLVAGRFLSHDGKLAAILVELDLETESIGPLGEAVHRVEQVVRAHERPPAKLHLAGVPLLRSESIGMMDTEQRRLTSLNILALALFLFLFFRCVHGVLIPLMAVGAAVILTVGGMGWLGITGDMINIALPTLLLVIGIADAVHVIVRFHEEQLSAEITRHAAAIRAIKHVGAACFLTSLTTAIGFASLSAARMEILNKFGWLAAAGVAIAYFGIITWVPLGLSMSKKRLPLGRSSPQDRVGHLLAMLDRTTRRYPRPILGLAALVIVGAVAAYPVLVVDARLTGIHPDDHPSLAVNRLFERHLGGSIPTEVLLEGEPGAMTDPDVLRRIQRLHAWLGERDEAGVVVSHAQMVAELHRAFANVRDIPESRNAVAQLLLLAEGDSGIEQVLASDHAAARMAINGPDIGAHRHLMFVRALEQAAEEIFAGSTVRMHVTGTSVVAYRAISSLITDLFSSIGLAFGLILLVMFAALRSLRLALLSMVPNVFPLLAGGGAMALLGLPLEPATTIVFAIALGIAVDDTVHFLARYREEREGGAELNAAVSRAMATSGRALLYTTVVLGIGFLVIASTPFRALSHFGLLGFIILNAALVGDLLVLPVLLRLWGERISHETFTARSMGPT